MSHHLSEAEIVDIVQNEQQLDGDKKTHVNHCAQCRRNIKIQRMMAEQLMALKLQHTSPQMDELVLARLKEPRSVISLLKIHFVNIMWGFLTLLYVGIGVDLSVHGSAVKQLHIDVMGWQTTFMSALHVLVHYFRINTLVRDLWLGFIFILFFLWIDLWIRYRRRSRFL